ncbi:MAG: site-specific integrase [Candidatus Electrothrix sp. GW3-4]|uniref:tyrosine-type recombinase/integrase n=1 Tax=Candidatus Electrothrix sp. GW3-4 TaxID=3126740 RepID=UPI0030D57D54
MPRQKRVKTKYPGVYYIQGEAVGRTGKERIYYIFYRKNGKQVEEKAGRQYQDDMTPARAAGIRAERIEGKHKSNRDERKAAEAVKHRWTTDRLWEAYRAQLPKNRATRTDSGRYEAHLKKPFGNKEPKEIVKLDTDRVRINLLKTHSPQTVKHVLVLLKRIINFGYGQGWIAPLAFKITIPRVDNIKTEDLTPEQLQSLFDVLETTHRTTAANMMKLVLFTGLRRGEMFKLQWDDIDFERGFIHIREPKGGKSQKIPLNNSARVLLHSVPKQESEYIFPARGGGPRKDISKDVRAIKEAAGLPADFRPLHGLRHVYATMLANSGKVDMFTLQKLMTHKSPQMTQRYAHHRDEAMQRASNEVSGILEDALSMQGEEPKEAVG